MTLNQDQAFLTDKDAGIVGDCLRTTIANLLHLDRDSVPHFVRDNPNRVTAAVNYFLRPYGIAFVQVDLPMWKAKHYGIEGLNHEARGRSPRGVYHSVAACDEDTTHDPHPSHAGLDTQDSERGVFVLLRPWEAIERGKR